MTTSTKNTLIKLLEILITEAQTVGTLEAEVDLTNLLKQLRKIR